MNTYCNEVSNYGCNQQASDYQTGYYDTPEELSRSSPSFSESVDVVLQWQICNEEYVEEQSKT